MGAKLALFDCDGTLVDSQFAIHACMLDAFAAAGLDGPTVQQVRQVVGLPLKEAISILCIDEASPIDDLAMAYSAAWQKLRAEDGLQEPMFDGMAELLSSLYDNNWTLGVATGKSTRGLSATLEHHRIGHLFDTLQTADKAQGKPHPEMIHMAMDETGLRPEDVIMIGDTTFDIEMAVAANVRSIGVAWGYHDVNDLKTAGADVIVANASELSSVLLSTERN